MEFARDDYDWALEEVKRKHSDLFSDVRQDKERSLDNEEARKAISKHKNIGAVIYDFRFRRKMPDKVRETEQPEKGLYWRISLIGKARYCFVLGPNPIILPAPDTSVVEIFEAIPEVIAEYSFDDEQALLAKVRYNRLVDTFLGVTAHSLQNHLRTFVEDVGQIEIDELYVGHDGDGREFVIPVQAKGKKDKLSTVQTEQDLAFCRGHPKFSSLTARPVSAQFLSNGRVHLFEMGTVNGEVRPVNQRCYSFRTASKTTISRRDRIGSAVSPDRESIPKARGLQRKKRSATKDTEPIA